MAKVNGSLIRATGHGIEDLHASELCDIAYSMITEDLERHYYAQVAAGATFKDGNDPLGDAVHRFEERIGLLENPEAVALALHRRWLKARGIPWDDTPVGQGANWWEQDVDDFRDMTDLDKPGRSPGVSRNRGVLARDIKPKEYL